jgi:cell fate regulator YaaT (PSP1 superfamily)
MSSALPPLVAVKLTRVGRAHTYVAPEADRLPLAGEQVVVETESGPALGAVVRRIPQLDDRRQPAADSPQRVVRIATRDDILTRLKQQHREQEAFRIALLKIRERGLGMKLARVEQTFDGTKLIFYFTADARVDFRELVRELAAEFRTRIEMRQIGVRDEAKLLADYGDCGKPVCCNTHLSEMPPVSMKMAKLQRATLDPSKISGRCGRLKCCLRYEYDTYQDLQRDLPPVGAEIITNKGRARVLAQEILAGQVLVETEDMRRIVIDASDVLTILKREKRPRDDPPAESAEEQADELSREELPPELAKLEDTAVSHRDSESEPPGQVDGPAYPNGDDKTP